MKVGGSLKRINFTLIQLNVELDSNDGLQGIHDNGNKFCRPQLQFSGPPCRYAIYIPAIGPTS